MVTLDRNLKFINPIVENIKEEIPSFQELKFKRSTKRKFSK